MTELAARGAAYLAERAALVNAQLDRLLPSVSGHPQQLVAAMRYSVLGGGKRLRPALLMAAAEAVDRSAVADQRPDVLAAAAAIECIHAYSLIHDDLPCMDDGQLRHGKPTCHRVYGEALAVLAGDALLSLAFDILAHALPEAVLKEAVALFASRSGWQGMVGGQVLDLSQKPRTMEELTELHLRKTGALFEAAVVVGGHLGGATAEQTACLRNYARHFGLAFQIADDILDVVGEQAVVGKDLGIDQRLEKFTYVNLLGLEGARHEARKATASALEAVANFGDQANALRALVVLANNRQH